MAASNSSRRRRRLRRARRTTSSAASSTSHRAMADFAVRPAAPADLVAIGRLGALLVAEHHAFDTKRFLAPSPHIEQHYAEFIGRQLGKPAVIVLVAERDGVVLGYI